MAINGEKKSVIDYNALEQVTDSTWGRSSTPSCPSYSVKFSVLGNDNFMVKYLCVVNLVNDQETERLRRSYSTESSTVIDGALKRVKEDYKKQSGKNITFKQVAEDDSFEIIDLNIYNGRRTAYYRKNILFAMK
jgi:hypothetical protein